MKIMQRDLVLEVGSGDKPYPRSDVLLDKVPEDSSEREAGKDLVVDRPLVIGDVQNLPFADKTFDYVIASHVLEHVHDPAKFLNELSRVGKRGYIETPLPLRERLYDWPFHRWYAYLDGQKLVLIKKTAKSEPFYGGIGDYKKMFHYFDGTKLPNLHFEWNGKIDYKIFFEEPIAFLKNLDKELKVLADTSATLKAENPRTPIVRELKSKLFLLKHKLEYNLQSYKRKKTLNHFSLIVCPECRGKLKKGEGVLKCLTCGREYALFQGKIPCFLSSIKQGGSF